MSVHDLCRDPATATRVDALLSGRVQLPRADWLVPPRTGTADRPLLGTAFDYALRFELERRFRHARSGKWIAEEALEDMEREASRVAKIAEICAPIGGAYETGPDGRSESYEEKDRRLKRLVQRMRRRIWNARTFLRKHLLRRKPRDAWIARLAEYAHKLARMDEVYRGRDPEYERVRQPSPPELLEEICALLKVVPFDQLGDPTTLMLNPGFGAFSDMVGGADADLISGNRLIDFKAVSKLEVDPLTLRQLVIYLMLARQARAAGDDLPELHEVGIYFARHALVWCMPVAPIVAHAAYEEVEAFMLNRYAALRRLAQD